MSEKKAKRIKGLVLCVLVFLCLFSSAAYGEKADLSRTSTLTACYHTKGYSGVNDVVNIYRIADITEQYTFSEIAPFNAYPTADINKLDADGARSTAYTLASYAAVNELKPTATKKTDETGSAFFSDLKAGVYLVVLENVPQEGSDEKQSSYSAQPVLVALPNREEGTNRFIYDVTLNAKPAISVTYKRVLKIWENDTPQVRPESIKVQLYARKSEDINGKYVPFEDPIVLSRENNWQYVWPMLPTGYEWQLEELDVPAGYSVSVVPQGSTMAVVNTFENPPPPVPPDDRGDIPVTGTTWYLVPFLVCFGLIFLIIGVLLSRKEESFYEK